MKYYDSADAWIEDALLGGTETPVRLQNISLTSGASVSRGDVLCCDSLGAYAAVSLAADSSKPLCIAAADFVADSVNAVTQAYFSGTFNREKVSVGGAESLTSDAFEQELRKQNIHLTSLKD